MMNNIMIVFRDKKAFKNFRYFLEKLEWDSISQNSFIKEDLRIKIDIEKMFNYETTEFNEIYTEIDFTPFDSQMIFQVYGTKLKKLHKLLRG